MLDFNIPIVPPRVARKRDDNKTHPKRVARKRGVNKTHPKPLVRFIIEAIDEVAPGQGEQVYWRAFERFEDYDQARVRKEAERDLQKTAKPHKEEWTAP